MKKSILAISLAFVSILYADVAGIGVAIGGWSHDESGWIQKGGNEIDVENDLHFETKSVAYGEIYFEHPLPLFPNIKVSGTKIKNNGEGPVSKRIKYGDLEIEAYGYEKSDFEITQVDTILYYELLDNPAVNLDLGLNVRYMDGFAEISAFSPDQRDTLKSERKDFTITIPMIYLDARLKVPATSLSLGVTANAISYSGSSFYDTKIYLNYDVALGFGMEMGYRYERLKIDDIDDISSDLKIKGPYAGVYFRF
ncbi:MAG: TIGR04219 family outer membrane beta-barrel protein [Epsilonproteobacteria bacterium]|nr:TIGR04219 family outer membrane beta-barrel protein [Campylobacterota bacterium]